MPADETVPDHRRVHAEDRAFREGRKLPERLAWDEASSGSVEANAPIEDDGVFREGGDPLLELGHRKAHELDELEPIPARQEVLPKFLRFARSQVGGAVDERDPTRFREQGPGEIERLRDLETGQHGDDSFRHRVVSNDALVLDEHDRNPRPELARDRKHELQAAFRHDQNGVHFPIPVLLDAARRPARRRRPAPGSAPDRGARRRCPGGRTGPSRARRRCPR